MITAGEDFLAAEAQKFGTEPVFFFSLLRFLYDTGVGSGRGTFVNVSFVAPGRLEVDEGAGYASWTSEELQPRAENYPITITPTWDLNYPGFEVAIEFRTATSEGGLAATPWTTLVHGSPISLYRYYQWRIVWVAIRAWAFDTVEQAEADGSSAWALDMYDPEDQYQSYATDTAFADTAAFIENVRFTGIYEIPLDDVLDPGISIDECSPNVGELVAGDHTLILLNRQSNYSPLHENFILANQPNYKKLTLRIEMAYRYLNGQVTSRIITYEGTIQRWGPTPHRVDQGGKMQEHTVTILSRDVMADIMEQKIGKPDDDGKPNPLVFGMIFRQADQMADETLGDPDAAVDFESGDTAGLGVDSANGGVVSVESADPINGVYYLHTEVANANAYAKGRLDLTAAGAEVLFSAEIRFTSIPENPADKNMHFLGLFDNGGTEVLQLYVGSDFRVWVYAGGQWKETEWYINRDVGVPKTVSIGVSGVTSGTLKVWLAGNEIMTWDGDWSGLSIKGGFIGPHNGAVAEAWAIDSDSWKIFPNWWPQLYRVWGGPFESIGAIYTDGAIKVGAGQAYSTQNRRRLRYASPGLAVSFVGGATKSANIEKYPDYGAVAFTDYANPVNGTVMMNLTKNSCSHPVDIIAGILIAGGKEAMINDESFALAAAARPNDSIGAFFENCTIGDAVKAVAATCLLDVYRSQNQIKIRAYSAIPPTVYDFDLDESELIGTDPIIETAIKNQVFVKWGWYQRNSRLSHTVKDEQSIADEGLYDTEIDFSHGGMVESDNGEMAKRNAELLLRRLIGGMLNQDETSTSLRLARLEPGDAVRLNVPYLGAPIILQVRKKKFRMGIPRGVDLRLVKFLGEIAPS